MKSGLRGLASDTLVYGISTILQRFLTFLLTPLYSNVMTPSQVGDVASIYAVIAMVNIAYSLGMEPAFMRFYDKADATASDRAFGVAVRSVTLLGIGITICTVLGASWVAASPLLQLEGNGAYIVAIAAFIPLADALVLIPFARLRMQQRPKQFALLRLLAVVVNVVLNAVFLLVFNMGVEGVVWAGLLSSASIALVFAPQIMRGLLAHFDRVLFRDMIRFGLPTVPSSISGMLIQVADRPIVLMMLGSTAVGLYQTNFRLALPMMMLVTVFEYAWRPFYLNHRDDADAPQLFARVMVLFSAGCGVIFLLTSLAMPAIVALPIGGGTLIHPSFWSALGIVPIVLAAYYLNGITVNLAAGFHISKRTGILPIATGVAAGVGVIATLILIPIRGLEGAAWAKVVAYGASAAVMALWLPRVYAIRYAWGRVAVVAMVAVVVYYGAIHIPAEGLWRLAIAVAATAVYAACVWPIAGLRRGYMPSA